jgi:O-antigen ligase
VALFLSFAAAQAESRGATTMTIVLWIGFLFICSVFMIRFFGWKGAILPSTILALFLTFVLISISNPDRFERLKNDYEKTIVLAENPELEGRYYMFKVTNDMIAERPWLGHGAGSFRYIHLRYASSYRDLAPTYRVRVVDEETGRGRWESRNLWFRQAHLDLSEFVIEWGIIGCSFIWLSWLWAIGFLFRNRRIVDYGQVTMIWTGIVLIIGAAWEFHFRVPLLPLAWCLIMTAALKVVHLRRKVF